MPGGYHAALDSDTLHTLSPADTSSVARLKDHDQDQDPASRTPHTTSVSVLEDPFHHTDSGSWRGGRNLLAVGTKSYLVERAGCMECLGAHHMHSQCWFELGVRRMGFRRCSMRQTRR